MILLHEACCLILIFDIISWSCHLILVHHIDSICHWFMILIFDNIAHYWYLILALFFLHEEQNICCMLSIFYNIYFDNNILSKKNFVFVVQYLQYLQLVHELWSFQYWSNIKICNCPGVNILIFQKQKNVISFMIWKMSRKYCVTELILTLCF